MGASFFRLDTMRAFDRQTDRWTDRQNGLGYTVRCIRCSRTVKTDSYFSPIPFVITALHALQTRSSDENSVCPSAVCLSL